MSSSPANILRTGAALLLAGLCSCAPKHGAPPAGVALVIGINAYDEPWPALVSARSDAEAVGRVLADRYGFEVRRRLDAEATREALLDALDQLGGLDHDATVIIFYAGHGVLDNGEGYWIPSGAAARAEGIAHGELIARLLAAAPRRVLLISDACFGGALLGRRLWDESAGAADDRPAKYVIASGDLAPVPDAQGTHSVFARALLEVLANPTGRALSVSDLVRAMDRRLRRLTGQVVRAGPLGPETDGAFMLRPAEK